MRPQAARRQRPEEAIHIAIVEFLRLVLLPGSIVHGSLNEEADRFRRMLNARLGACAGFADLVVFTGGRVLFFEVKAPDGRQSGAQEEFQRNATGQGHVYAVVRSINDVVAVLQRHEVRLRIALHVPPRKGTAWD